jgi:multidrug efflux system outer membrane protein
MRTAARVTPGAARETNYFSSELNLVQAQLNKRLALVQLYQALGGGCQE